MKKRKAEYSSGCHAVISRYGFCLDTDPNKIVASQTFFQISITIKYVDAVILREIRDYPHRSS